MEQKKKLIIDVLYAAIIIGIVYLIYKFLLPACLPFIFGIIFAYIGVKFTKKVFKKDDKLFKSISLAIVYLIVLIIVGVLLSIGITKIVDFFKQVPTLYKTYVEPYITLLEKYLIKTNNNLPSEVNTYLNQAISAVFDTLKNLILNISSALVSFLTTIIAAAPDALINITIMVISSVYFILDYEKIINYLSNVLNDKVKKEIIEVKYFIENNLFNIIKSYGLIMFITFIELVIGLTIFKINNSVMLSLIISILDIFPVLGVGTILIPWGITCLFISKIPLGIEILVLYIIITVIRNIIEPKFVGGDLGLHPLVTLIAMIVGLRLFGIMGMIGIPLIIAFFITRKK